MGDCFSQYPFLDHSYDTDEKYQKACQQLCAHNMWIRSVLIFNPNHQVNEVQYNKIIVTCGDDEYLKLWNAEDGYSIVKNKIGFGMNCLEELCFKDEIMKQYFVIGGESGNLIIYDYSKNNIVKKLTGSTRNILSVKVLPNKKDPLSKYSLIVTGNSRGEVRFWNWQKGMCIQRLYLGIQPVQGLNIWEHIPRSKNKGFQMLLNSYEHKVNVWNTNNKTIKRVKQFSQHTNWVRSIICQTIQNKKEVGEKSSSVNILISAGDDNTIRFFNMVSGACLGMIQTHTSGIISMEVFNNNLVSCETCGRIAVTKLDDLSTYSIATGLCFDYYKGFSLEYDKRTNRTYLGVVGSSPKKSSYHFLNIYRGKMIGQNMVFDLQETQTRN